MAVVVSVFLCAHEVAAQPTEGEGPTRGGDEGGLDDFVVPGLPKGLLSLELGSGFAPVADAGGSEVAVWTPGGRLRLQAPISERVAARAFIGFGTTIYDVKDTTGLFSTCREDDGEELSCPDPGEFFSASSGAQAAFLLNPNSYVLFDGERWAFVGEGFIRGRWERGEFAKSLNTGLIAGIGYELTKRLRVAAGAQIDFDLESGGVSVGPTASFRWDITEWLRLRNRGFGLQLELREFRRVEFFAAGYRSSDDYRLRDRAGFPSGAQFQDRRWQIGGGIKLKLARWLRLTTEVGGIVDRRLSIEADGEGTLADRDVDASPYVDVRLEWRP